MSNDAFWYVSGADCDNVRALGSDTYWFVVCGAITNDAPEMPNEPAATVFVMAGASAP
jgi:hypothetical protein